MFDLPMVRPMPTMTTELGTLIVTERMARGWTQRDVAERGGVSHVAVGNAERAKTERQARPSTLWGIAQAFATEDIDVGKWFARLLRAAGYPLDATADAVVERLTAVLSDENRRLLLEMSPEELTEVLSLYSSARRRARDAHERPE